MKTPDPYKIWYPRLKYNKITFKSGDHLIIYNPNFSKSSKEIIKDIFDQLQINNIMEYEYRLNYHDSSISIYFGTLI